MADNYLEKKMEDYKAQPASRTKSGHKLGRLLEKNRSYRGYDNSFVVRADQLSRIIEVNTKIPSARNQQVLRFRPVLADEAHKVLPYIRLGGALRNLHLPFEGHEPRAFVVICNAKAESDHYVWIDLGISAQSMLLQATEIGLGGICIGAFDHAGLKESLGLELEPLLVVAIGKPDEKIVLTTIAEGDNHDYWRDEQGVHYVPKLSAEEITIKG
ncbi:MAG: nitroreductase family protein [Rikenellaceae bacterium]|nr:nitroreductase family protein [Rikenellaceae bacterium]